MRNSNRVKIVVLGGSGVATPELAAALAEVPERFRPIDLVLVGRSPDKLETIAGISRLMTNQDPLIRISTSTDAAIAVEGAEIILNQIRVGGLEARAFDESFPSELGLPGEETVGPGGFANASRTIPVVLEYAKMIERIAPQATLLTFSNPSSLVQYAISCTTNLRTIGLCDAPITLSHQIATALDVQPEDLTVDYFGMHHFGWVNGVWRNGKNVISEVLAIIEKVAPDIDPAIPRALGVIPGLYHNYFFHPDRMLARKLRKRTRAEELLDLQAELMSEYEACLSRSEKPAGLSKRKARWYRAIIAPVMLALVEGRSAELIINQPNGEIVPWLPKQAIVEAPARIDQSHIRPFTVNEFPLPVQLLIQKNCAYEMLAVEAIIEQDRNKALQALLLNPMIQTFDQATRTLDKAWSWGK